MGPALPTLPPNPTTQPVYLVRYGLMRHVGAFTAGGSLERGQVVVVVGCGTELGEVLAPAPGSLPPPANSPASCGRPAPTI